MLLVAGCFCVVLVLAAAALIHVTQDFLSHKSKVRRCSFGDAAWRSYVLFRAHFLFVGFAYREYRLLRARYSDVERPSAPRCCCVSETLQQWHHISCGLLKRPTPLLSLLFCH